LAICLLVVVVLVVMHVRCTTAAVGTKDSEYNYRKSIMHYLFRLSPYYSKKKCRIQVSYHYLTYMYSQM